MEEATQAVAEGKAAGTVYFPRNFSAALQYRRDTYSTELTKDDANFGAIHTALDMGGKFTFTDTVERRRKMYCSISDTWLKLVN